MADDGRNPRPEDWGALNQLPEEPPQQIIAPRRRYTIPPTGSPASNLIPADMGVDVPIKANRSYTGLLFMVLILAGAGGLYYVMTKDAESDRVRGNPNIQIAAPSLQAMGQVPDDIKAPPPPTKALLRLESEPPGATVIVNGNLVPDKTPTAVQTIAEQPVHVAMSLAGHVPAEQDLQIAGGEGMAKLTLTPGEPETASLTVTSDPEKALVTLAGEVIGETPVELPKVVALHPISLRIRKEGFYDHTVLATLTAGQAARIGVRLAPDIGERKNATISIETNPLVANIDSMGPDGKPKREGTTGMRPVEIFGRMGFYLNLVAKAPGHGDAQVALDIKDPYYTLVLRLPPPVIEYGTLSLEGPKDLTVYLDSEELDPLPLKARQVKAGEHDVVVVDAATRAKVNTKIAVGKDQSVTRKIVRKSDGTLAVE
ncbi:MAG: PEGA domain-containing protein [Myxococcales bacterium]|nr:PEGA domain-containing protein [Myxococcales bacterium]